MGMITFPSINQFDCPYFYINEEKDACCDQMDESECDFFQSGNRNQMGHLCQGSDCFFKKHVRMPLFHPLDPVNLSKTFRRSVRIDDDEMDDMHTRATMQEGSSRRQSFPSLQNAGNQQEMVITEEPEPGTSSDREEFLKDKDKEFLSKYSKAKKLLEVRPDESSADNLYNGPFPARPILNAIQEVNEPEISNQAETEGSMEEDVSHPLYQNQYRFYSGEQDSGLDTEESKADQNSDPEAKLDMIKALHEENCTVPYEILSNYGENTNDNFNASELEALLVSKENIPPTENLELLLEEKENISPTEEETSLQLMGDNRPSDVGRSIWNNFLRNFPLMEGNPVEEQNPVENFDRKRKSEMPTNELEEPKIKKVKCDQPKETTETTAPKTKQVKRKITVSSTILNPVEKKPKMSDLSPDKSQCDNEKTDNKPKSENEKADEAPNTKKDVESKDVKDKEPKDDKDKPGSSKNNRSGA